MAEVKKLSIRGVRSFSPNLDQTIAFLSPLTLIYGANGCGKTTVVEALKYATTGALPPNNSSKQAFLNDPQITDTQEVKAAVRLRFRNRGGDEMAVIRNLQLKRTRASMTFKSLDGVMIHDDPVTGERVSTTQKCAELDDEIPVCLGISKAVLEHVVFCHQEESTWPLDDTDKALKKRFDEIFESTRYAKALDAIREARNRHAEQVKDLRIDQADLRAKCDEARRLRLTVERQETERDTLERERAQVEEQVEDIQARIDRCNRVLEAAREHRARCSELEIRERGLQETVQDLEANMDQPMDDKSDQQLRDMLEGNDDRLAEMQNGIRATQNRISQWDNEIHTLGEERDTLRQAVAREQADLDQLAGRINARNECLARAAEEVGICLTANMDDGNGGSGGNGGGALQLPTLMERVRAPAFATNLELLKDESKNRKNALSDLRRENQRAEQQAQNAVSRAQQQLRDVTSQKESIEEQIQRMDQQLARVNVELRGIGQGQGGSGAGAGGATSATSAASDSLGVRAGAGRGAAGAAVQLERARQAVETATKEWEEANRGGNAGDAQQRITECQTRIQVLDTEIEEDDRLFGLLEACDGETRQLASERARLDADVAILRDDVREAVAKARNSRQSEIEQLLDSALKAADSGVLPADTLDDACREAEAHLDACSTSRTEANDHIKQADKQLTETSTRLAAAKEREQELIAERDGVADSMTRLSGLLDSLNTRLQAHEARHGPLSSSSSSSTSSAAAAATSTMSPTFTLENANRAATAVRELSDAARAELESRSTRKFMWEKMEERARRSKEKQGAYICPCCTRPMSDEEFDIMLAHRDRELNTAKYQKHVDSASTAAEDLASLEGNIGQEMEHWATWNKANTDLPGMQQDIGTLEESKDELRDARTAAEEAQNEAEDAYQEAVVLRDLVRNARDSNQELTRQEEHIKDQKRDLDARVSSVADGKTLEEVREQRQQRQQERSALTREQMKLQNDQQGQQKRLHVLDARRLEAARTLQQLESDMQRRKEAEERANEFRRDREVLATRKQEVVQSEAPRTRELRLQEKELQRVQSNSKRTEDDASNAYNAVTAVLARLKHMSDEITSMVRKLRKRPPVEGSAASALQQQQQQHTDSADGSNPAAMLDAMTARIEEGREALVHLREELARQQADLNTQQSAKQAIRDNLRLRTSRKELEECVQQLQAIREDLAAEAGAMRVEGAEDDEDGEAAPLSISQAERDLQRYRKRQDRNRQQCAEYGGHIREKQRQIDEHEEVLGQARFRNIEQRNREQNMRLCTTQLMVEDLDTYHAALDRALLNFHQMRIAEINKTIRELWRQTYQHGDVDTIQIQSSEEGRGNRSFTYRVVMCKGETVLDMRGRCSAGQKMLASLVIRLALAETFCLTCGIIALDEPTTNLDLENKRGLAEALARLIALRKRQQNFQLVCITHDREFVSILHDFLRAESARITVPEFIYHVRREEAENRNWFSRIDRVLWDDMP